MYSTCTFNHYEDEDNVAWLASEYGFEVLEQRHFYPGDDMAGEGFFFSLLRKEGGSDVPARDNVTRGRGGKSGGSALYRPFGSLDWVRDGFTVYRKGPILKAFPGQVAEAMQAFELSSGLRVMMSGSAVAEVKDGRAGGKYPQVSGTFKAQSFRPGSAKGSASDSVILPQYSLIQSEVYRRGSLPEIAVPLETALACLRRDTYSPGISTPAVPFGLVKNLGSRCNNLLPPSIALRKR